APPPESPDVPAHTPRVADLREGQAQAQSQPLRLGNNIDEVGLRLVGDVQLQELLGDAGVECEDLLAELIKDRPQRARGEVRVVVDRVHRRGRLRPVALEYPGGQYGGQPDGGGERGESAGSFDDGIAVPGGDGTYRD